MKAAEALGRRSQTGDIVYALPICTDERLRITYELFRPWASDRRREILFMHYLYALPICTNALPICTSQLGAMN